MGSLVDDVDVAFMKSAAEAALNCVPSEGAYSVGAALVSPERRLLALGFSRELPGNTHAEECALIKARAAAAKTAPSSLVPASPPCVGDSPAGCSRTPADFRGCTMYSTMEPCSTRLSGKPGCSTLLIEAGVTRVVMGIAEPPNFVACEGVSLLKAAGIVVDRCVDADVLALAERVNSHLLRAGGP